LGTQNFCTFCKCHLGVEEFVEGHIVVAKQQKRRLPVDIAGAGGVMVIFAVAFGFCYGCAAVAVSTRLLSIGNESVVNVIALIFSTGVAGYK